MNSSESSLRPISRPWWSALRGSATCDTRRGRETRSRAVFSPRTRAHSYRIIDHLETEGWALDRVPCHFSYVMRRWDGTVYREKSVLDGIFGTRPVTVACFFIGVVVHNRRVLYSNAHVTFPSRVVVHRITTPWRVLGSIIANVLAKKSNFLPRGKRSA